MKKTTLLLALTTLVWNLNAARRACLWAALGFLAALAFGPPPAQAAVTEAWVHRYNNVVSNSVDQAVKVVRDAAGDIIVTGSTDDSISGRDILTIKYSSANGSALWQKRYNGPANGDDYASAMAVDGSGNVVVAGPSYNGTNRNYYTAKYAAASGALLWEKRYPAQPNGDYDYHPKAVAVDSSGNVVVTGSSRSSEGFGGADHYTIKYAAADGVLLWEKRYNSPGNNDDDASALAVDGSDNVVVTGSFYNGTNGSDHYTVKYAAADGALLWEQYYNGPANNHDFANAVAVDGSGNVVVTGSSHDGTHFDYYTAKYAAANGALLWEKRYNGPGNGFDEARAVTVDGSGNVVVTGLSQNTSGSVDYYTAKYAAANGALLWEKRHNTPGYHNDSASAVTVDGGGNVVVTGSSDAGIGINRSDYYTAKYAAADGALLWEKSYNGPGNGVDEAHAVTVDGSGNVVVTGASDTGGGLNRSDYYTAKYAAADGALLWEKRYNGPANLGDSARAVAVDGSGNVVVTGDSFGSFDAFGNPNADYYTAKYAAADGTLIWERRYNGPANSTDVANAVAVDNSGNVLVTGWSYNETNNDYYTAKYAAADGALLWEKRYNGPQDRSDSARAVAVDSSGNVVVTGFSDNINGYADYYTAKYAAANGALLWEQRYNGPANSSDYANALAVDSSGNVVVTGYSDNGTNDDYYTAKYATANGALLWEKRYHSPANSYGCANALAVDGSGNVVVTGYSGSGGDSEYLTIMYAAADGALLWEKRHNDPAKEINRATAVAVDGIGNVVVTGFSGTAGGFPLIAGDYYTAKYAAADGALLWEQRYDGPANYDDYAQAVAVDGSGNVVVTGYSGNSSDFFDSDYYTAKYAAADGALLWEKRYHGPANGYDYASSLALGPNGMVAVTGTSSSDYATVVYWENLPPVSIEIVPTGVRLRFTGVPGRSYNIKRAIAVTGPWSTLATPTAPLGGLIEYVDTTAPLDTAFYRTTAP